MKYREIVLNGRGGRIIRWIWAKVFRIKRLGGVTIGYTVIYTGDWKSLNDVPSDLRDHEFFHVLEAFTRETNWGPSWFRRLVGCIRFWSSYSVEFVRRGYRNNKYEVAARKYAGQE